MIVPYPAKADAREAVRQKRRAELLEDAERRAEMAGRTMKCVGFVNVGNAFGTPRHRDDPDGCRNDGSGCLCPCHDTPKEARS